MSKKTICEQRRAIHPRPQGDEVFWHDSIKKMDIKGKLSRSVFFWIASLICLLMCGAVVYGENKIAGEGDSNKTQNDQLNEQQENYDAHRSYVKVHFNDIYIIHNKYYLSVIL